MTYNINYNDLMDFARYFRNLNQWQNEELNEPDPAVTLQAGMEEMIKITKDGFYVRGVLVPADEKEAETVYLAFKQWLTWAHMNR